ncbi:MAG: hypothetical protein Q9181_002958 [Wetmoreana brouardii]
MEQRPPTSPRVLLYPTRKLNGFRVAGEAKKCVHQYSPPETSAAVPKTLEAVRVPSAAASSSSARPGGALAVALWSTGFESPGEDMTERLSKEDEAAVGNDETEVRREDQDKINKFSRLHQRELLLEEELKGKAKDKEDLEEISNELELADEVDKVPYKLGDAFIMLPLPEVQELLSKSSGEIEKSVSATESKMSTIREEMELLKVDLYESFDYTIDTTSDCRSQHENDGGDEEQAGGKGSRDSYEDKSRRQEMETSTDQGNIENSTEPTKVIVAAVDAKQRYQLENEDNLASDPSKSARVVLSFPRGDLENPYNWSKAGCRVYFDTVMGLIKSQGRKTFVLFVGIVSVINSTLGSSLPSGAIAYLADYFHITNQAQLVLPISLFLVGYVFGPVIFAPLSETYGRKGVMVTTFIFFTIFTMACAAAPNWPFFLVFRLLCGITASSAIAVVGGLYADIYADPITRGRALAFFMAASAP